MLGHLKVANCSTNESFKESFQLSYCSICDNLRANNSLIYSAFLNIEMTIALMALDEFLVFENEFTKCPTSFNITKKKIYKNKAVDTAGNLSIILGWLKSIDIKEDKPNLFGITFIERKLRKNVGKFNNTISTNTLDFINEYIEHIKIQKPNFDTLLHLTGNLSKILFLEIADNTNIGGNLKEELAKLFYDLGKIILYSDHLLDIEKDIKENNYNPISVNSKLSELENAYDLFYLEYLSVLQSTKQLLKNQNFNKGEF